MEQYKIVKVPAGDEQFRSMSRTLACNGSVEVARMTVASAMTVGSDFGKRSCAQM